MNDKLSQNEIDALIQQAQLESQTSAQEEAGLSETEIDTLGEIGNISMGAAATALYSIINRKVVITTPEVSITTIVKLAQAQTVPYVVVNVEYTEGFSGSNLYVLRTDDVKAITDIMMGGEGEISDEDLSELHISAISEAMNQMMGGMATSLAEMFDRVINISPPNSMMIQLDDNCLRELFGNDDEIMIQIRFRMEIEGLEDSSIMQLIPLTFGKQLVCGVLGLDCAESEAADLAQAQSAGTVQTNSAGIADGQSSASNAAGQSAGQTGPQTMAGQQIADQQAVRQQQMPGENAAYMPQSASDGASVPYPADSVPYPRSSTQQQGYDGQSGQSAQQAPARQTHTQPQVDVRPVQLSDFDDHDPVGNGDNGIDIILDVPLQVSVVLGKTKKTIKDVMDLNIGSIVTLDKVAGEPVDVVVNGKVVAHGEVIVIDDNYGIRVTEVISSNRVRTSR